MRIILNAAIVLFTAVPLIRDCRNSSFKEVFKYYTTLSNVLCAIASLVVIIALLAGHVPQAVTLLKYCGTVAVTVTLLTVLFFLAPAAGGLKPLITGSGFFLHLVNPLLAILTNILWEKPVGPFWIVLLGALSVLLYGVVYLYRVVVMPAGTGWEDFYGFNKEGKWRISFAFMLIGVLLISLVLWLI